MRAAAPILIVVGILMAILVSFVPFEEGSAEYTGTVMFVRLGVTGAVAYYFLKG
jgi:hypothetical protein